MKWFTKNKKDINYQRTIKYFTAFKQHVHVLQRFNKMKVKVSIDKNKKLNYFVAI